MKLALPAAFLLAPAAPAFAQCEMTWLQAPPEAYFEHFAQAAIVDGDTLAVGAAHDDVNGERSGSTYVFGPSPGGWVFVQYLLASDGAMHDHFGDAIDIVGDTLLIGARNHHQQADRSGVAYIFERIAGSWTEVQKIFPADSTTFDQFSFVVSMDQGRLIGTSAFHDAGAHDAGAAYIFERVGGLWTETAKLTASDPFDSARFGSSVLLEGDRAFVGAIGALGEGATAALRTGALYVFEWNGSSWIEVQKLVPSDGEHTDRFGNSVDLDGTTLLVGSPRDDDAGTDSGAVYVFEDAGGAWVEAAKLSALDAIGFEELGQSVGILGDVAMAGAWSDDHGGNLSGSVYRFQRYGDAWLQNDKLVEPDPKPLANFGYSICSADPYFLLTATRHDDPPYPVGGVWLAPRQGPGSSTCQSAPNSVGPGAWIGFQGSARVTAADFVLAAGGAPPGQPGLFYYGPQGVEIPFGDGFRCVGAGATGIFRLGPPLSMDPNGGALRPVDFDEPPASSGPGAIEAGDTWHFQLWYRDPAAGSSGFNLSNGLAVTFCP